MDYKPPFTKTDRIDNLCMDIAELVGSIVPTSDLSTSPTLHRKLRISTIHSSLMIEGNTLPMEAVTAILDGKRVLGPAQDIREVENARKAYAMLDELDPANMGDLLRVHGVMMEGLVKTAGAFRSKNAGVYDGERLVHAGTHANYVPELMADLFGWIRTTQLHPLPASCVFHYEFEFIHPFADGNGRTGRLWQTLMLSKWKPVLAWLPVESVILERQQGYYAAFAESESSGSCEAFVEFMLEAILDALGPYAYGADIAAQREQRALAFLESNPHATAAELAVFLGCSKRTTERIVAVLKETGLLVREGSRRSGVWRVKR